jgi:hypothetical protein
MKCFSKVFSEMFRVSRKLPWAAVLRIRNVYIPDPDFYPFRIPDPGSRIPDQKTATKEKG